MSYTHGYTEFIPLLTSVYKLWREKANSNYIHYTETAGNSKKPNTYHVLYSEVGNVYTYGRKKNFDDYGLKLKTHL